MAQKLSVIKSKSKSRKIKAEQLRRFLAEEKARQDALLSSIGDGIIGTDEKGNITVMNVVAKEMLGWTSEEVMGKSFFETVVVENEKGEHVLKDKQIEQTVFKTGKAVVISSSYYTKKDGQRIPVAINIQPVILRGKIIGTVNVFRDITEEKKIERAKNEFISIATHQLKTPLTGLRWIFESLRIPPEQLNDKQKEYFRGIQLFLSSLSRTMEDLLNVSRAELGMLSVDIQKVSFENFIKKFVNDMTPYAKSQKHEISLNDIDKAPSDILTDIRLLQSILQNLVSNAIEYSPAETKVVIDVKIENQNLKISVINQGSIISQEARDHIFEKFYRAPEAKRIKAGGTGIGLYIVKVFTEKLGGKVGFEAEEGKDTVFWFTIPLKPPILKQ